MTSFPGRTLLLHHRPRTREGTGRVPAQGYMPPQPGSMPGEGAKKGRVRAQAGGCWGRDSWVLGNKLGHLSSGSRFPTYPGPPVGMFPSALYTPAEGLKPKCNESRATLGHTLPGPEHAAFPPCAHRARPGYTSTGSQRPGGPHLFHTGPRHASLPCPIHPPTPGFLASPSK